MLKKNLIGMVAIACAVFVGGCTGAGEHIGGENIAEASQEVVQGYYKIDVSTRQIVDSMLIDDGETLEWFRTNFPAYEFVLIGDVTTACPDVDLYWYYDPNHDPVCSDLPLE